MLNIVKFNEKGIKIIVGGYSYTLQHTLIKTKRRKCSNKTKNNCPGTLSSSWELTNSVLQIEHNHAGNNQIEIIENFKNEIKSRSRRTCDKPSQIFAEAVSQIPAKASIVFTKRKNQRTSNNPALNCINDVVIEGCLHHIMYQSSYRKIQDLGLTNMYKNSDEFSHFCGILDGLAFLPLDVFSRE
ncbi:Uncharacterized protein FWK35_00028739, partial [Aphis craccivora]